MVFHRGPRKVIWKFMVAGIVMFVMFFTVFSVSCGKPMTTLSPAPTPAPASTSTPPAKTAWSADGVIEPGEYSGTQNYAGYEIHWTSDGQYIYIAMKAHTTGWVAVGLQPGTTMKGADIILAFVTDGKTTVYDMFSTGDFGPHPQDTELGGTNDILEFGGKEEGGYTTIEFKRKLNTGDKYDIPFVKGANQIMWAYGSDDQPTQKHISRGLGEINL